MASLQENFVYRTNADGTVDSICCFCFTTVAKAKSKSDVKNAEREHICDPTKRERLERAGKK